MTWILKKIHIYSLFLSVFILNAHMIIPHDHHQADSDICQEESSSFQGKDNTHHPLLPHHCHAFNNMTFEKGVPYIIVRHIPSSDLIPGSIINSEILGIQYSCERAIEVTKQFEYTCLIEFSSLRAPPVIC